jgi:signal transduction histidine kinase
VAALVAESRTLEASHPGLVLPTAVLVAAPLTLTWWRPVAAVTVAWLAVALSSLTLAPLDATLSQAAFALASAFAVAVLSRPPGAVAGLVVCSLGQLVCVGADLGAETLLFLAWLGGLAVNEATRLVEKARANNELLARQEDAAARRAVVQERLRLAREVHDAVGHTLTVVALQAGAARRLAVTDPERAREVMRTVGSVARSGAASLLLEEDVDLEVLLEHVRGAGLVVETDVCDVRSLTPHVRQVVFRVVQEALTNVLRHAPGSAATVTVRRSDATVNTLDVVVTSTPPRAPGTGPGTGRGLIGIRERVAAAGGETWWGPRADGCFEVRAALPIGTRTGTPAETGVRVP